MLDIRASKGYNQHYVALHETTTEILKRYDTAVDALQPQRTFFFEKATGGPYDRHWVNRNFKKIWVAGVGTETDAVPYDFRHHYAVMNIMSWEDDSFSFHEKLQALSKSMGHSTVNATLYYYNLVPRLADKLRLKTESGFNEIVPEVWDEEE